MPFWVIPITGLLMQFAVVAFAASKVRRVSISELHFIAHVNPQAHSSIKTAIVIEYAATFQLGGKSLIGTTSMLLVPLLELERCQWL